MTFDLCAGRCDCLIQGVREDFRDQDRLPFPFNPQGSLSQLQGFKLLAWKFSVCVCVELFMVRKSVCDLKCSGAERTKCTRGFSLQLVGLFTDVGAYQGLLTIYI